MRRFELVSGTSRKFWAYEVRDATLTVRFGRIGSSGQTRTKALATPEAANAAADKLVREKIREGYVDCAEQPPSTAPPRTRSDLLREAYGFELPDQVFAFWQFARPVRGQLRDLLGVSLCGPFDVLAGRFDSGWPDLPMLLHMRFRQDPPEFFTVMLGSTDGEEWGIYSDDPEHDPFVVAHYYRKDAYEIELSADLFEALRAKLEMLAAETENDDTRSLRAAFARYPTGDRRECGEHYLDRWDRRSAAQLPRQPTLVTSEGVGIVVPENAYRPVRASGRALDEMLAAARHRRPVDLQPTVDEALGAAREGFPGAALQIGRELWPLAENYRSQAHALLAAAYDALGRRVLANVVAAERAHPKLDSIDLTTRIRHDAGKDTPRATTPIAIGDMVDYPGHGRCEVMAVETKVVAGQEMAMLRLRATASDAVIWVPEARASRLIKEPA